MSAFNMSAFIGPYGNSRLGTRLEPCNPSCKPEPSILPEMPHQNAIRRQTLIWSSAGLALLGLLYLLGPILTPFLLAGILAYILAPLVELLARRRIPRLAAVILVMLMTMALLVGLALILLPLVREEADLLMQRLPEAMALWNEQAVPWLQQKFGIHLRVRLDPASLHKLLANNWDSAQTLLQTLLPSLKIGGMALVGLATNLMLAPIVMFYLLLDWHELLARLDSFVPRPWHARTQRIVRAIDAVLAEFLRGQISVMLALALYYSIGLWLAGISFALPVGILTGLLIFIPYVGIAIGLVLALLVALLQFSGPGPLVGVAVVFAIGQVLEGFLLTPWLVGNRIGLHPLAVIFALLAFGQLFGFFGILLALPASAALLVGLREIRTDYLASHFYRGDTSLADTTNNPTS